MNQFHSDSLDFVHNFNEIYFKRNDLNTLLKMLDDEIEWFDEKMKIYSGFNDVYNFLNTTNWHDTDDFFIILDSNYNASILTCELCSVNGFLKIYSNKKRTELYEIIISHICRKTKTGIKLKQICISSFCKQENSQILKKLLDEKDKNLNTITNNIPGGVMCCDCSDELNLIQYSSGFLSMFGYTKEDIKTLFNGQFIHMIYPDDRKPSRKSVDEQMAKGNTKEIEYRVICKNNELIWVLDRGQLIKNEDGKDVFYCILIDNTKAKTAQEELRLSLERYQIIINQTADIIFEWDIKNDIFFCSRNWEKKFGYPPISRDVNVNVKKCEKIFDEDKPYALKMIQDIYSGILYTETEIRILNSDKKYIWCRIRITLQIDKNGTPSKAVGVIVDIDNEKRNTQKLQQKAETDALTGLYNKGATRSLIESYLCCMDKEKICAFMIIDVDNFKQVNDSFGHLSGDVMLSDIAEALQKQFRTSDIIGRIGGDEFAVLMKNINNFDIVNKKAKNILDAFNSISISGGEGHKISGSIGISIAPRDGINFSTLYKNSDKALYYAKIHGKNNFAFYSSELHKFDLLDFKGNMLTSVGEKIDSEKNKGALSSKISEYVFHVLYHTPDTPKAIPKILEIIGRQFEVSRVYIFEDSDDGKYTVNTFEWCNEGVMPQKENLQHVLYAELENYYENFNEDDIFYCRNISHLSKVQFELLNSQNIKSTLQCIIRDNGNIKGFMGFDECITNRLWTKEQLDILSFISEIVSIFLLKKRAQFKMESAILSLETILNYQDLWIYVIDKDTFQIIYANTKTLSLLPELKIGAFCYEVFFKNKTVCSHCPTHNLRGDKTSEVKIYSPVLEKTVLAKVTLILWEGGKEAYLLSCQEIEDMQ